MSMEKNLIKVLTKIYKKSENDVGKFKSNIVPLKAKMGKKPYEDLTVEDFERISDLVARSGNKKQLEASENIEKEKDNKDEIEEIIKTEIVQEGILDAYNKERSFVFQTKDGLMDPNVKKEIMDILELWMENLPVKFKLRHVRMIGSMTGFQYTDISDIDINVMTDLDNKDIWVVRRLLPNGNLYPGTNHPINFWIGGADDEYDEANAENIYDLLNDKWIKKTEKDIKDVPEEYILEMSRFLIHGIDSVMAEYNRDKFDFYRIKALDPERHDITHQERKEKLIAKGLEVKADIDGLQMAYSIVKSIMRDGYKKDVFPFRISIEYTHGEKDKRFSVNNLIFKTIDRYGYVDKLEELRSEFKEIIKEIEIESKKEIPEGAR